MRALHIRLTLALAVLLALLAIGLLLLLERASNRYADELRQRLDAGIAMYVVRELALMSDGAVNQAAWRELANRAMTVNPSAEVYLLDPRGVVVASALPNGNVKRPRVSLEPVQAFLRSTDNRPLYGDDPSRLEGQRVFSVAPIEAGNKRLGYLYVVLGGLPERSIAGRLRGSFVLRTTSAALGLALLTALLAGAGLFAVLTRRLRALERDVAQWSTRHSLADGAPQLPVDEISALKLRFEEMSGEIERQLRELKSTDTLRRELVANISHDLRTPLASLRGYIETMLVRGGGTADELRFHLTVALRQADQLGQLIDALFELARLESGTVQPRLEVFPMAELLQDVALRFRLAAERRGISLQAALDPSGVLVEADVQLIERALSNLLENALRYTPRGGQVRMESCAEPQTVRIRVADTGEGFDSQDLPHIFDRYHTGRDRADPDRLGLGLAIVKRIIDLHSQTVSVQSQPGIGTTVEFTLRRIAHSAVTLRAASA